MKFGPDYDDEYMFEAGDKACKVCVSFSLVIKELFNEINMNEICMRNTSQQCWRRYLISQVPDVQGVS